ncbi:MAG TPA: OmpA family protein [Candidatus Kapabacteria bacterium]|nr:OmpA family protein [Candidatus Kapabacteria bacterium]
MYQRPIARAIRIGATLALQLVALLALSDALFAQETGERWPKWWYGVYGGANINLFSGAVHDLGTNAPLTNVADSTGFDKASGLGLALGGILEYNSGNLLGGNLMVGYDNRSVGFDTRTSAVDGATTRTDETLAAHLAYVTIEPNVRVNLGNRLFHLMVGPSFRILVAKSFDYGFTDVVNNNQASTQSGNFPNIRSFVVGGQAGLGYDIPLSDPAATTQMVLTPFAQFHITQDLLDDPSTRNTMKVSTIRAGVELKFGSVTPEAPPPDVTPSADFVVRAPNVVTESRKLNETFPMRNYVFFDQGSTELPARYKRVTSANDFREDQLVKPGAETGNAGDPLKMRSQRQMDVYYNVINVFGDRLRRNPAATVKLIGSANGDAAAGRQMAENVKSYLVSAFGIDPKRITTAGTAQPAHRSGSGATQGEDRKLVDAENYRVEIEATPDDLLQPVTINSVQEEPIDNDILVSIPERNDVAFWNVTVTDRDGNTKTYGPFHDVTSTRIDSKELLGSRRDGRYKSRISLTTKDGKTVESPEQEFRLVRADAGDEQTGVRYSILFEFDESKTVQTYENFLVNTVAPAIPNGSSVIIHGHTDVTGDPDYNTKLSQRRSDEVQKILTRELTKAGKTVTFDTYGFGEDERRSPFNNTLPEQRYYNRTVVIEIVPGK